MYRQQGIPASQWMFPSGRPGPWTADGYAKYDYGLGASRVPVTLNGYASGSWSQMVQAAAAFGKRAGPVAFGAALLAALDALDVAWDGDEWVRNEVAPTVGYKNSTNTGYAGCSASVLISGSKDAPARHWCESRYSCAGQTYHSHVFTSAYGFQCRRRGTDGSPVNNGTSSVVVHVTCPSGYVFNDALQTCVEGPPVQQVPLPPGDWEQAVDEAAQTSDAAARDAATAVGDDPDVDVIPDIAHTPPPISGPPSVSGDSSSSTSSGPSGTSTTTTTSTWDFDYSEPGTVAVDETVTTTTTNPDGSTSTKTDTKTGTGTGSNPPQVDPNTGAPPQSICSGDAKGSSACAQLDDVQQTELPTDDLSASLHVTPTSGSCPPPISITVMGHSLEFSWARTCEAGDAVNPLVRALAALSAGIWLIFMTRAR